MSWEEYTFQVESLESEWEASLPIDEVLTETSAIKKTNHRQPLRLREVENSLPG